jgi:putative membrane protein
MKNENRGLLIALGALVLVLLAVPLIGGAAMGPGMMGPGMMGWGWGEVGGWGWGLAMSLGVLMMLAFWGAIIVGVVLLVRMVLSSGRSGATSSAQAPNAALEVLKRRYAAGEITHEEFERMRQVVER